MTREEIEKISAVEPYCFETDREERWYEIGCIDGLKAADAEPNLESIWHDSSEEPKLGEDIIALDCDGLSVSGVYEDYHGKGIYRYHCFLCELDAIAKWAYVSDLLPKTK